MDKTQMTLDEVPLNRFHNMLTLRAGAGFFVDGYVLSILGVAMLPVTDSLQLNTFWQGMIAASALIGIFFGGFLGGSLSGKIGRKKVFLLSPILFIIASFSQYWVESAVILFLLRFLTGVAVGIDYPVSTSLMVEFLPRKNQGPRLAALGIIWFAGAAFAYILGETLMRSGDTEAWRTVLLSGGVLGFILLLLRLGTPESPRWLFDQKRKDEALKIVQSIFGKHFTLASIASEDAPPALKLKDMLFSGYLKRMIFVVIFWTSAIVPVFAVYAFAPKVLAALNIGGDMGAISSVIITVFFVVGCILATAVINLLGRRNLLLVSLGFSTLALLGLGYFSDGAGYWIVTFFSLYAIFIGGAQVLTLVYPNEIFPTSVRSFAVGMGTSVSRIGAALGTYLVPISLDVLGAEQTMYAGAVITFVGLVFSVMYAPETKSMSLQDAGSLG